MEAQLTNSGWVVTKPYNLGVVHQVQEVEKMRCSAVDFENINRVMSDDSVYPFACSPNGSMCNVKNPVSIDFINDKRVVILSPHRDMIFIFIHYSDVLYQGHSAILPESRGKKAIKLGKDACKWMFDNTKCCKIIGMTPVVFRGAIIFSLQVGFKKEGLIKKSHLFNGKMEDMIIFGMEGQQ